MTSNHRLGNKGGQRGRLPLQLVDRGGGAPPTLARHKFTGEELASTKMFQDEVCELEGSHKLLLSRLRQNC